MTKKKKPLCPTCGGSGHLKDGTSHGGLCLDCADPFVLKLVDDERDWTRKTVSGPHHWRYVAKGKKGGAIRRVGGHGRSSRGIG